MNKTEKAQRNKKSLENLGWKTSKKTPCELQMQMEDNNQMDPTLREYGALD